VTPQRALASVNVAAIERNCARLLSECDAQTSLCAVVKADGYGHGAVESAHAALRGGASWLAVVSAGEARELREAGLGEVRILVMGALAPAELREALEAEADVVVWSERHVAELAAAGGGRAHVKLDTGMGRLGTRDAGQATLAVQAALETRDVELAGLMTHFATADELEDDGYFDHQLTEFERWAGPIKEQHSHLLLHAANSAATMREPRAHFDMVRCGIAVYGLDPFGADAAARGLYAALELSSYVAEVKPFARGESAGYGRRFIAPNEMWLGVLPIGYGDGIRRGLSNNAEVLVAGERRALVGTVSMDNVTIALGQDADAERLRGEPAVLIGAQGSQRISAEEVAARLGTINYEITCGVSRRVPRSYHRDGDAGTAPAQVSAAEEEAGRAATGGAGAPERTR
jgi:alanine racemase